MGVTLKALYEGPVTVEYRKIRCPCTRASAACTSCAATRRAWNVASAVCYVKQLAPWGHLCRSGGERSNHPTSPGERYAKVYEVNLLRCVFCGDCEEACPTEAIVLGQEFAMASYNRRDFILVKEQLLNPGEPNVVIRPE